MLHARLRICPARTAAPGGTARSSMVRAASVAIRCESAAPKRVLITGGNTGIGYETALGLLKQRQQFEVTIACRDMARAEAAQAKLSPHCPSVPGAAVHTVPLDLADLDSVRVCASRLLEDERPFDVLINNAGVMACPKAHTKQGFEYQLGVNHLGHFLLTCMLLPPVLEAWRPCRVINLTSAAHMFGSIDFEDLMRERPGHYNAWEAYGQSKLANVMFTYELARRLQGSRVTANCVNPGVVKTELGRYMPSFFAVVQLLANSPERGARTSVYLASSPDVEGVTSQFYVHCRSRGSSKASYDQAVAARLWDISAELTNAPTLPWHPCMAAAATAAGAAGAGATGAPLSTNSLS